jgi:hypothetical protein
MTKQLKEYMTELASNVDRLTDFVRDPLEALKNSDLSEADQALLQSGDQGRIYSALRNLPTPPASPPTPAPQLPTVVAAQYPYGVPGQGAAAQSAAPQGYGAQAAPQWPTAGYGYPPPSYALPLYYALVWPYSGYQR